MRFEITPLDGAADHGLVVRLLEVGKAQRVTLEAETTDGDGKRWSSSNQFLADDAGIIDLSRDAPARGSYFTMHPLGLVTTMVADDPETTSVFATADAAPMVLRLRAEAEYGEVIETTVTRRFQNPDVERREIEAGSIHGTLFVPPGARTEPAVVLVPGSLPRDLAALPVAAALAHQGYVTFVAAMTNVPGLPDEFHEVPLEHLHAVLEWLRAQPGVDPDRVAAVGFERGAEGLLAAASHIPELALSAVVAIAPSCVAWQADDDHDASAWSLGGVPLPCGVVREGVGHRLLRKIAGREHELAAPVDAYRQALEDSDLLRRAGFPVQDIAAPLCLLAGGDDRQWPSGTMGDHIYRSRGRDDADQMVVYAKAGRLLRAPYVPATGDRYVDAEGRGQLLGGHPDENRRADVEAWAKITEFLGRHLGHDAEALLPLDGRPVDPEWPSQAEPPSPPDPDDELARAIVRGVDIEIDGGSVIRNPLPAPPPPTLPSTTPSEG